MRYLVTVILVLCLFDTIGMAENRTIDAVKISPTEMTSGGNDWPVLTSYDQDHLARIALPVGGIGTGTVSLGGRGDLRDWEIMNRAAKGYTPRRGRGYMGPFFAIFTRTADGRQVSRALEGTLDVSLYEGSHGSPVANHGLPRFASCSFDAAYPFGQVLLSDPGMPLDVRLKAFNPLVPGDPDASGIPVAVLTYELTNPTGQEVFASVCGSVPNFIGMDGSEVERNWKGDWVVIGAKENRNEFRRGEQVQGIYMTSDGVDPASQAWGTIALTTSSDETVTSRTDWLEDKWGNSQLDFWDDFSVDGRLETRAPTGEDTPMASLAVEVTVPPRGTRSVTFFITWHFPNRKTWTPAEDGIDDMLSNYYTTRYADAWDVAEKTAPERAGLESETKAFVSTFCSCSLPDEVKEAALYNVSTLRTQTCFRLADGRFFGWEGSCNQRGCCHGSCTHVWNYEQATAFLFGELARSMREVEFGYATDEGGLMSFRVSLPLERATSWGRAAADGQMGCIMKMYRDWQLSGDDAMLRSLWPKVRKAVEFCWIDGGWDADKDGVMEGCQHNTMDVEYYGPNPQMGIWYLGALRAAEEMAGYVGDTDFADTCHALFENGSVWLDENLFNGQYYIHHVQPPEHPEDVAPSLLIGMGSEDLSDPAFQLGEGCLVDQLVGQFLAHVCGLGYLTDETHVKTTLESIMTYNLQEGINSHFNCMRSFVLGDEKALLMASYPGERPVHPFPYFTEAMTGFEYAAAVGMLYEGQTANGLACIRNIRDRYDGLKRSPFDEAECGHHYSRAMASWGAVLALTGFQYSAVEKSMTFGQADGDMFWSNGSAWGTCRQNGRTVELSVRHGSLELDMFSIGDADVAQFKTPLSIDSGETAVFDMR